jgi:hypothetical protein
MSARSSAERQVATVPDLFGCLNTARAVQSWLRADCAALDLVFHDAVLAWVERDWPFDSIEYAPPTRPARSQPDGCRTRFPAPVPP